ncbi:phosphoinositide phosphatase SAC8-like isoform X2 [Ipomoea triloba]|uniref:phosphoinositide phosphatase SAC8-like isoform X2 n=1 Tax=Ipomoea triloba TaxID=35885 RepID=UPI00125CED08|nr:phosphoinositide phosphatase SAC8-like isoform X2 [Ipomoea triloba]
MAWRFCLNFADVLELWSFTLDEFVQGFHDYVRGSIPLLWEQIVDLSYKPQLNIIYHEETQGDEGKLSAAYAAEMQKLPNVRYASFDFHHICGSSSFENIELLYDQISEDFEKQGFFMVDKEGKILAEQKGIIRSDKCNTVLFGPEIFEFSAAETWSYYFQ